MARSVKHSPFIGNCSHSDKPGKILAHRSLRAAERQALSRCRDWDDLVMPVLREVSNVWSFPKDGKHRLNTKGENFRKWMRK